MLMSMLLIVLLCRAHCNSRVGRGPKKETGQVSEQTSEIKAGDRGAKETGEYVYKARVAYTHTLGLSAAYMYICVLAMLVGAVVKVVLLALRL
jgi:hypothetical protein